MKRTSLESAVWTGSILDATTRQVEPERPEEIPLFPSDFYPMENDGSQKPASSKAHTDAITT